MSSSNKVILIGLDGADPDFIKKHRKKLCTINALIKNGVFGKLKSTIPPLTGAAWSAAMSGMNPAKTGITDFVENAFCNNDKLINSKSVNAPRIWDILDIQNKKAGVIAVPLTYPVDKLNGFMVSGFPAPSQADDFTYPIELLDEIPKHYKTAIDFTKYYGNPKGFLKDLYEFTENQFKLVENFMLNKEWDFFTYVLSGTDWIQHFFCKPTHHPEAIKSEKIILDYFIFVDTFLGKLLSNVGNSASVIIISDHGFGKFTYKHVYLNAWLKQQGYLYPNLNIKTKIKYFIGNNLRSMFSQIPFARIIKEKMFHDVKSFVLQTTTMNNKDINWDKTKAFFSHSGYNSGYVRINRKAILSTEIDELKEDIVSKLGKLKDPCNGKLIIEEIYKREDIYSGPHIDKIPDIVFTFHGEYSGQDILADQLIKEIPLTSIPGVAHKMNGIFIAKGPDIMKDSQHNANIIDITPTVYHLMDVALPQNIDGQVLKKIFHPESPSAKKEIEYWEYRDIDKEAFKWSNRDKKEIKKRLMDLGYL